MSAEALAMRNRALSAALVAAALGCFRAALPDEAARTPAIYLTVVALGYGHLIGGAVFARERLLAWVPPGVSPRLAAAFAASSVLTLLAAYGLATRAWPVVAAPLLALSVWHALENDLHLGRAYAAGGRSGPVPRAASHHLLSVGIAALVAAVFTASLPRAGGGVAGLGALAGLDPGLAGGLARMTALGCGGALALGGGRGRRLAGAALAACAWALPADLSGRVGFAEVFGAWTLYHVVSWFVLHAERSRALRSSAPAAGRSRLRSLVAVHAAPAAACAALLWTPIGWEHPLRVLVFSPPIYLFWASLHVAQTLALRGLEARGQESDPSVAPLRGAC